LLVRQDGSEEIANLDRCHAFKRQPMIEDFIQNERRDTMSSFALLRATRNKIVEDESQSSQLDSLS